MRRGHLNKGWIVNDQGETIGISLGADFCAEHEWGLNGIRSNFGLKDGALGIDKHKVHQVPINNIIYAKGEKFIVLWFHRYNYDLEQHRANVEKDVDAYVMACEYPFGFDSAAPDMNYSKRKPTVSPDWEFSGAWSENAFAFSAPISQEANMDMLYEGFKENDLVILVGGVNNPFDRGGLVIARYSKIPNEVFENMKEKDLERKRLEKAAQKPKKKIFKALSKAGSNPKNAIIAISPAWISDKMKDKSQYEVMFWLNPHNQRDYSAGWFTVEDLLLWAENKGPVLKAMAL